MAQRWTKEDLRKLRDTISECERTTEGEIRVSIERRIPWHERRSTLIERALREFHRLGMQHTKGRTGVLIFISIPHRQFHIVADEGIAKIAPEKTWVNVAQDFGSQLRQKPFMDAVGLAVKQVGRVLSEHLPANGDNRNELSNEPTIR
ncbi:MAG TPA: TPM domain-containing protein [Bdellovibrionota bacterium]|nr:TPM domain-containing protein [Bdellovibrionota bacterium]